METDVKLIDHVEWITSKKPVDYSDAVSWMEARVDAIRKDEAPEAIWLLEHPPLYTAGTSAQATDIIGQLPFPVFETGRGGKHTYHGPGQRVIYTLLDLKKRGRMDMRQFVHDLERWMIMALATFGVKAHTHPDRIGLWIHHNDREEKIGAIGVRVRSWVTFHGAAININPDLSHFAPIVPCGIKDHGVTSFEKLGLSTKVTDFDQSLLAAFGNIF